MSRATRVPDKIVDVTPVVYVTYTNDGLGLPGLNFALSSCFLHPTTYLKHHKGRKLDCIATFENSFALTEVHLLPSQWTYLQWAVWELLQLFGPHFAMLSGRFLIYRTSKTSGKNYLNQFLIRRLHGPLTAKWKSYCFPNIENEYCLTCLVRVLSSSLIVFNLASTSLCSMSFFLKSSTAFWWAGVLLSAIF